VDDSYVKVYIKFLAHTSPSLRDTHASGGHALSLYNWFFGARYLLDMFRFIQLQKLQ